MEQLIRPNIRKLKTYTSARDEYNGYADVFLDANESPFNNGTNRYPDPYQNALKTQISGIKGIATKQIILGNGSDEILDLIFRSFCEPKEDRIIICPPTYGMYEVLAQINAIAVDKIPLNNDFTINTDKILAALKPNTKLIVLCSPNNPTGNSIDVEDIEQLLIKSKSIVLVDEAYIDFSEKKSAIDLLKQYPNLIVIQTLSKAWGMASLRIGMAFASEAIIKILNKVKPPYNLNGLSQQKAILNLKQSQIFTNQIKTINNQKRLLRDELEKLNFIEAVYPSDANFLLVKFFNSASAFKALEKQGIIVRDRSNQPLCENCLRISIGKAEENKILIQTLKNIEA